MQNLFVKVNFFLLVLYSCTSTSSTDPPEAYQSYCGSCHIPPNPEVLPKSIWRDAVLPEMGARLGLAINNYNPYERIARNEWSLVGNLGIYPNSPLISIEDWEKISSYILENAPDTLVDNVNRYARNDSLSQFVPEFLNIDDDPGSYITYLGFQDKNNHLMVGDAFGNLRKLDYKRKAELIQKLNSPVIAYSEIGHEEFITEMGQMPPTQIKTGKFWLKGNDGLRLILDSLHRPVYAIIKDLNNDNKDEILIGEYGHYTGHLTLLAMGEDNQYSIRKLIDIPGVIKVVVTDMNSDQKDDVIALAAQGDECVYILYQEENLRFRLEKAIRFSPIFGSSWMEVIDYENDGDLDIVVAQGDNADYSFTLKTCHGVRIYINDGKNKFSEVLFYPIFGATRVVAHDFDEDNDIDLAVTSFFPDFDNFHKESFVYLENIDPSEYRFKSYTFPGAVSGRWLIMDKGDLDNDGDTDIILGSFTYSPTPISQDILKEWTQKNIDLVFLKNQLKN